MQQERSVHVLHGIFNRTLHYRSINDQLAGSLFNICWEMCRRMVPELLDETFYFDPGVIDPRELNELLNLLLMNHGYDWNMWLFEKQLLNIDLERRAENHLNEDDDYLLETIQEALRGIIKNELFHMMVCDLDFENRQDFNPINDPEFAQVRKSPPSEYAVRLGKEQYWMRQSIILYLIARYGLSIRHEILSILGQELGITPKSGSLKSLVENVLAQNGILVSDVISVHVTSGKKRMRVLRLTDEGRSLCELLGWEPIESEWERLIRLHDGHRQQAHTAAVLMFAYHARRRGWNVEVLPQNCGTNIYPDASVSFGEVSANVEVELGRNKINKWRNTCKVQGFTAICASSKVRRDRLIKECAEEGIFGIATDLESLIRDPWSEHSLWSQVF